MKIEIKFRDDDARLVQYYLRKRYGSKAEITRLAKMAIREAVADTARKEIEEIKKAEGKK